MGKHNAPDAERPTQADVDQTQVLAPVLAEIRSEVERTWPAELPSQDQTVLLSRVPLDEPERERSKAPVRIAVLVAVVATVMLSALVWTVNRRSDPEITALRVDPPSLSSTAGGMLDIVVTPAGGASTASPVLSASVPSTTGGSVTASPGLSPTSNRRPVPPPGGDRPATTVPTHPPTTSAVPPAQPARLAAQYQKVSSDHHSYKGKYTITNRGGTAAKGWTLVVTFSGSGTLTMSTRDVRASSGSNHSVVFTYSGTVSPGGSTSFTFTMEGSNWGSAPTPTSCSINGGSC
ncbi:cellulose binding domain-containing protein [Rugosimonospora africana]|uniref:CBM2 domain-containing protein n=1 Tax=Rugosimonospora africana TaxID=556532 RepID=A0A8J3QKT0_9ACTN|nr:cellulose binding domain-containing protein [Rugosimonospora africana]GIH12795.1 hypothetical protein Raf01_09670 [Rugosimonospora africana]